MTFSLRFQFDRAVVTDAVLYTPAGSVGRWVSSVERTMQRNAVLQAPNGAQTGRINKTSGFPPGYLQASISSSVLRAGPRRFNIEVRADAPYAYYVHEGTSTIYARTALGTFRTNEEGMFIPGNPGWGRSRRAARVRGQAANPFFDRAFRATSTQHPSLKGYVGL